ncbi:hypothetical protein WS80_17145 [Burkholderia pseudomultivorans]|nr:hypothetical protein WS80_17145 [Burkholderia pseudomultivorans]
MCDPLLKLVTGNLFGCQLAQIIWEYGKENGLLCAHGAGCTSDALLQPNVELLFCGARISQIGHVNDVVTLSDTVDTPYTLLDLHRVPRQVEVDQQVSGLEIQTFGGRVGA